MTASARTSRQSVSLERARKIKALRRENPAPPHPSQIISAELSARGWSIRDLAARLEGDPLRNRALLNQYLRQIVLSVELGAMWCGKVERAFGWPADTLVRAERAWIEHVRDRRRAAA